MSEDKKLTQKEALNQINENVKSINQNTSHFGSKIKVPSGNGPKKKQKETQDQQNQQHEWNYSEFIVGALSVLNSGQPFIPGSESRIISLLKGGGAQGGKDSLYSLVKKIADNVAPKKSDKNNSDSILKSSVNGDMLSLINTLGSGKINEKSLKNNIKIIKGSKESLSEIIELFAEISKTYGKHLKSVKNISTIVTAYSDIIKIASENIDEKKFAKMVINIRFMNNLIKEELFGKKGILSDFSDKEKLKGITATQQHTLESLFELYDVLFKLNDDLKLTSLIKLELKLKYTNYLIKTYIFDNIKLLEELSNKRKNIIKILSTNVIDKNVLNDIKVEIEKFKEIIDVFPKNIPNVNKENLDNFINSIEQILIPSKTLKNKTKWLLTLEDTSINAIKNYIIIADLLSKSLPAWGKTKVNKKKLENFADTVATIVNSIVSKLQPELQNLQTTSEKLTMALSAIEMLHKVCDIAAINSVSIIGIKVMEKASDAIVHIVKNIGTLDEKEVDQAVVTIQKFNKLITICGAALLAGALLVGFIKLPDLLLFSFVLGAFVVSVIGVLSWVAKDVQKSINIASDIAWLIAVSGMTLVLGSLFMHIINVEDLFAFGLILAAFIILITAPFFWFNTNSTIVMSGVREFSELVFISGGILILGALFMKFVSVGDIILFATVLSTFILTITIPIIAFSALAPQALFGLWGLKNLIAVSAATLLIGALFIKFIGVLPVILFEILLTGFILTIVGAYVISSKLIEKSVISASALALLVGISAGVLLIGGWFMSSPKRAVGAIAFAVLLALFIGGILLIFSKWGSQIKFEISTAAALALLVGISAFALLIGANFIAEDPWRILYVLGFGVILDAFIWFLITALKRLKAVSYKEILAAAATMGAAAIFVKAFGDTILKAAIAARIVGDGSVASWVAFGVILGAMGAAIGILFAIITSIGAASEASMGLYWVGVAAVAAIGATVWMFGEAMKCIGETMKLIAEACQVEVSVESMLKLFGGIFALSLAISEFSTLTPIFVIGLVAAQAFKRTASALFSVIVEWSNLRIPIYKEGSTEIIGYQTLGSTDVSNAFKNITSAVDSIFNAMNHIYKKGKDTGIFSDVNVNLAGGLISIPLPGVGFKVINIYLACSAISKVLSSIAISLKDWVDLKIPIYTGAKITGYKTIDNSAFISAANNIKQTVLTLVDAVIEAYDKRRELFEGEFKINTSLGNILPGFGGLLNLAGSFGPTKFGRIAKALGTLGIMLSGIADGLYDWTWLKIPQYTDKSGKPTGYITIDNSKLQTAAENIKSVILTFVDAITESYDKRRDFFEGDFNVDAFENTPGFGGLIVGTLLNKFGQTKFERISKAIGTIGLMLSGIADGLNYWVEMKIPQYTDNSGKPTSYITIEDEKFGKAAKNIKRVISTFVDAIEDAYNSNKEFFEGAIEFGNVENALLCGFGLSGIALGTLLNKLGPTKFERIAGALSSIGGVLSSIASGLNDWVELKIPKYNSKGQVSGASSYINLDESKFKKIHENIGTVITSLSKAIIDVYKNNPDMFKSDLFTDSPLTNALEGVTGVADVLGAIASGLKDWVELKIPKYGIRNDKLEIIDYVQLYDDDFEKVGTNIGKVITALVKGINNADVKNAINDNDWEDIIEGILPVGDLLVKMSESLKMWADLRIPQYSYKNDKLEITGYVDLTQGDIFNKIGVNVATVISTLVKELNTQLNVDPLKTELKGGEDSTLGKVIKAILPVGELLSTISEGLQYWSEFKVPIYGEDKKGNLIITGYKDLDQIDFGQIGKNVGEVITSLASAIKTIYDTHKDDLFKFDSNGNLPFNNIINAVSSIGGMLSTLAEGIIAMADLRVPVYSLVKGELKITRYDKITQAQFDQVSTNIGQILTSISNAIDVQKINSLSGEDMNQSINSYSNALLSQAKVLSDMATVIGYYASGEFPVLTYDSNGNLVAGKTINIKDKTTAMAQNIKEVISALSSVSKTILGINNQLNITPSKYNITNNDFVNNALSFGINFGKKLFNKGKEIVDNRITRKLDGRNIFDTYGGELNNALNNILSFVTSLNNIVTTISKIEFEKLNPEVFKTKVDEVIGKIDGIISTIKEKQFNKEKIDQLADGITTINNLKTLITKSITTIEEINTEFAAVKGLSLDDVSKKFGDDFIPNFNKIANSLLVIDENLNKSLLDNLKEISNFNWEKEISPGLLSTFNFVNTLCHNIGQTASYINTVKDITLSDNLENIKILVRDFSTLVWNVSSYINSNKTKSLNEGVTQVNSIITLTDKIHQLLIKSTKITPSDYANLDQAIQTICASIAGIYIKNEAALNIFTNKLDSFVTLISKVNDDFPNKVNTLKNGILSMDAVFKQLDGAQSFKETVEAIEKYTESINSLSYLKLSGMISLVKSLNSFTEKLSSINNIDGLVKTISEELTSALYYLSLQLTDAKKSINTADKLQEKRKALIEDSIKKIKDIMNQHMIVEISQVSNGSTLTDENGGTPFKLNDTYQTPASYDEPTYRNESQLIVENNEGDTPSPSIPQGKWNEKPLTYQQFVDYMKKLKLRIKK